MDNRKIAIIGGPCSGKSTLVKRLNERGYITITETAREVLEESKTLNYEKDIVRIQIEIARRQMQKEREAVGTVFLDRGVYDGYAYTERFLGHLPKQLTDLVDKCHKYEKIFIADLLPFQNDGLRVESGKEEAEEIHSMIKCTYESLGYTLIRIPIMSIDERADFVLNHFPDIAERQYELFH